MMTGQDDESLVFLMPRARFDPAVLGLAMRNDFDRPVVVYNIARIISILIETHDWTKEEALEFFEYNIQGAWYGDSTPVFIDLQSIKEIESGILDDQSVH